MFNTLLQVLDDGRLTDNKGRTVNFKNTIIIMTSNIGSTLIRENFEQINNQNRNEIIEKTKNEVFELLKKAIRPEFLNRIEEIIMFAPLDESQITEIVKMQLNGIKNMLAENGVKLEITEKALEFIAAEGYDPQFGARPVKRAIQRYVLNDLSKELISGKVNNEQPIIVDCINGKIIFSN